MFYYESGSASSPCFITYLFGVMYSLHRHIFSWIPWNLSFRYIRCTGQFTPKMKANAEPRLLSSLVWIDSGIVVSQPHLESVFLWNKMWQKDKFHGIHVLWKWCVEPRWLGVDLSSCGVIADSILLPASWLPLRGDPWLWDSGIEE